MRTFRLRTSISCVRRYDADRVVDAQGLSEATEERVWERVCADNRLFVILDLDFSDTHKYYPGTHPGILLIRARNRSASAVTYVLARVMAER
jgi:predicted nuclease of predicted toxin-antitoxin system